MDKLRFSSNKVKREASSEPEINRFCRVLEHEIEKRHFLKNTQADLGKHLILIYSFGTLLFAELEPKEKESISQQILELK